MESVLKGTIINAPVAIEDASTRKLIKNSALYLHVYEKDTSLQLTALIPEGTFHTQLSTEDIIHLRKRAKYENNEWVKLFKSVVTGTPIKCTEDYNVSTQESNSKSNEEKVVIVGKYLTNKDQYDEFGDLIDEKFEASMSITLDIKTVSKLPITIGSLTLKLMNEEEMEGLNETNILNWLDLLIFNQRQQTQNLRLLELELIKIKKERDYYKNEVVQSADQHQEIIKDVETKFLTVLNTKKSKIRQLQGNSNSELGMLNIQYRAKHKHNILKDDIDVDEIPNEFRKEVKIKVKRSGRNEIDPQKNNLECETQDVNIGVKKEGSNDEKNENQSILIKDEDTQDSCEVGMKPILKLASNKANELPMSKKVCIKKELPSESMIPIENPKLEEEEKQKEGAQINDRKKLSSSGEPPNSCNETEDDQETEVENSTEIDDTELEGTDEEKIEYTSESSKTKISISDETDVESDE